VAVITSQRGVTQASDPTGRININRFFDAAQRAEQAGFDFIFTADTNATFGSDDIDYWMRSSAASRLAFNNARRRFGGYQDNRSRRDDVDHVCRAV
jgi:alkanesulfonate monooxygenase SsuD/methylene tetrahydromethanopterin reductase-like flavin-dependent oxidoreductase (luciferase family)